jgi:type II secretory pathway predicted ATPase ExeA
MTIPILVGAERTVIDRRNFATHTNSETAMRHSIADRKSHVGPVTAEALARLCWLLQRPLGCGVIVGPARSGKSALLRVLAEASTRSFAGTVVVEGQGLDARSLTWELAAQWSIAPAIDGSSRFLAQQVRDFMLGAACAGQRLAIFVDHADRLEHTGTLALTRILSEHQHRSGLTMLWTAELPLRGDAAEHLLAFTELRIDCPAVTRDDMAQYVREDWKQSATGPLPVELARQIAGLSHGDLRRAERLSQLSQLAALAEETSLNRDMLAAVAEELA